MLQSNKFADYLETVRRQIRWKRAQTYVLEEIKNHLADQKDAFQRDGLDEETAAIRAIAEMGDPVMVGEQLDRTHRPQPDWPLLAMTAL
ncbi:MAG: permease prefix domain 1-containing protein, partial [Bacillota bacterium]